MADETQAQLTNLIKEQGEVVRKLKAVKADSSKGTRGVDLKSQLASINTGLGDISYIGGWTPTVYDKKLYDICNESLNGEIEIYPHLKRWFVNIRSYEPEERDKFLTFKKGSRTTLEDIVDRLDSTQLQDTGSIDKKNAEKHILLHPEDFVAIDNLS